MNIASNSSTHVNISCVHARLKKKKFKALYDSNDSGFICVDRSIVTMSVLQKKCQIYFGLSIILLQNKVRAICTCIKEDSELPTVFGV